MALIELEAALRALDDLQAESVCESDDWEEGVECAYDRISMQEEVDAVPVVRCGYCKHYQSDFENRRFCWKNDSYSWQPNDFCSYGERMDGKDGNE